MTRFGGPRRGRRILTATVVGLALTAMGVVVAFLQWVAPDPLQKGRPSATSLVPARIVQPKNGFTTTADHVDVEGTASASANSEQLWLIVHALDQGSYYPQTVIVPSENRWYARAGIGPPAIKRAMQFEIMLAEANEEGVANIHEGRNEKGFNEHGMGKWPVGVNLLHLVRVNRRPS